LDSKFSYKPEYSNSRALLVGINQYKNASPLDYAVNDAKELASILIKDFGFKKKNIELLVDEKLLKTR